MAACERALSRREGADRRTSTNAKYTARPNIGRERTYTLSGRDDYSWNTVYGRGRRVSDSRSGAFPRSAAANFHESECAPSCGVQKERDLYIRDVRAYFLASTTSRGREKKIEFVENSISIDDEIEIGKSIDFFFIDWLGYHAGVQPGLFFSDLSVKKTVCVSLEKEKVQPALR